jgi:DNA polymerase-4
VGRALLWIVDELCWRLRRAGLAGKTVSLKLRTSDFATVHRAETVEAPLDTVEALLPVARRLLAKADTTKKAIRLVGVSLSQFGAPQPSLFADPKARKGREVASVLDEVKKKFGDDALTRGALLEPKKRRAPRRR